MDELDHRHLGVKLKLWHLQDDAGSQAEFPLAEAVARLQARARPRGLPAANVVRSAGDPTRA